MGGAYKGGGIEKSAKKSMTEAMAVFHHEWC